jgi:hypothetical protein
MIKIEYLTLLYFVIITPAFGQQGDAEPVKWEFESCQVLENEWDVIVTATLSPGWHLYSQFIEEGGPQPTCVSFEKNNAFVLVGRTEEIGNRVTFHDDIYDMDISWFSGSVSFNQQVRLKKQAAIVSGLIEYMVCNSYQCVPDKKPFRIQISLEPK